MKPIPAYLRERMVRAVRNGQSKADVARRFDVSHTVVAKFVRLADEGESLEPKPHAGGPDTSLDDDDRQRLLEEVDKQPDATLAELIERCELEVSESTVSRELTKLDRPRKRKVPRASEQAEQEVQKARKVFRQTTADIDAKRLIFVDETSIATNMTRSYGRAPGGPDGLHRCAESELPIIDCSRGDEARRRRGPTDARLFGRHHD